MRSSPAQLDGQGHYLSIGLSLMTVHTLSLTQPILAVLLPRPVPLVTPIWSLLLQPRNYNPWAHSVRLPCAPLSFPAVGCLDTTSPVFVPGIPRKCGWSIRNGNKPHPCEAFGIGSLSFILFSHRKCGSWYSSFSRVVYLRGCKGFG